MTPPPTVPVPPEDPARPPLGSRSAGDRPPLVRSRSGPPRRRLGAVAISLALHGGALIVALLWFSSAPTAPPRKSTLMASAAEFFEPEVAEDLSEVEFLPEILPAECVVALPEDPPTPATLSDECDLPECEFEEFEATPAASHDIPLEALRQKPAARPSVSPAVDRPRRPAARPSRPRAAPVPPRRVAKGRSLKLVHRPNVMNYYPAEARQRGIEGEALIEIRVDASGKVIDAKVVRSSGSAILDRQALRLMYDYRFAAGDGGRARIPVNFRLR